MLSNNIIKLIIKPNRFKIIQNSKSFCSTSINNNSDNNDISNLSDNRNYQLNSIFRSDTISNNDVQEIVEKLNDKRYQEKEKLFQSLDLNTLGKSGKQTVLKSMLYHYSRVPNMVECEKIFPLIYPSSTATYTIMTNGYLRDNNFEKSIEYLQMASRDNQVDVKSYGLLVEKLAFNGQFKFLDSVIEMIKGAGIKLDVVIYTSILKSFNRIEKSEQSRERLIKLNKSIQEDLELATYDELFFSSLINALFKNKLYNQIVGYYHQLFSTQELIDRNSHLISKFWTHLMMYSFQAKVDEEFGGNIGAPSKRVDLDQISSFWKLVSNFQMVHWKKDYCLNLFFSYLKVVNHFIKNGEAPASQVDMPQIIQDFIDKLENVESKQDLVSIITKQKSNVSNELIHWYLLNNDIVSAWGHFQQMLKENRADEYTFYHILDYLSKKCQNDIIYNNIKEVITSNYYINLVKFSKGTYRHEIWLSILRSLLTYNQMVELGKVVELLKNYTFEDISFYSNILNYDLNNLNQQ